MKSLIKKVAWFLPRGLSFCIDVRRSLKNSIPETIFDVGANTGQSVKEFRLWFPKSKIYCFEPVASTFDALSRNVRKHKNVSCFKIAFGDSETVGYVKIKQTSDMNQIVTNESAKNGETVSVLTIDGFCKKT